MNKNKQTTKNNSVPYWKIIPGLFGIVGLGIAGYLAWQEVKTDNAPAPAQAIADSNVDEIFTACEGKEQPSDKFDCYGASFETMMRAQGARKVLELLDALQKKGGYAQVNCHPLSHKVGNIALHVYGSVPKAVPEYIPVCHSGYYHGLLEEYLGTAESYEVGVAEVCGKSTEQSYFNWFQCMHGLGHGIMQFRDNEVPVALKDCDLLKEGQSPEMCYAGVFMENITTDEKTGHPAKYIKKDDPIYPCNWVDTKYKSACYFLASSQILKINGWNFPETFKVCAEDAEADYRWLCLQSLGRDVSGSSHQDKEKVKQLCGYATDRKDKGDCYFGAVRDFVNAVGEFDTGIALCNFIEKDFQQTCYDGIFLDLTQYKTGNAYSEVCGKMPDPYRSQCMSKKQG